MARRRSSPTTSPARWSSPSSSPRTTASPRWWCARPARRFRRLAAVIGEHAPPERGWRLKPRLRDAPARPRSPPARASQTRLLRYRADGEQTARFRISRRALTCGSLPLHLARPRHPASPLRGCDAQRLARPRRQVRLDEAIHLAVEVGDGIRLLGARAVVFHQRVGVNRHRAYLVAKVCLDMRPFELRRLTLALLDLQLVESRLEHAHRQLAVLNLRALVLAGDDDACRLVADTDGGVGLVEMLATLARRAEGIHLQVFRTDVDLDGLVADVGHHLDLGEGGLAAVGGVKRREANQPMRARLAAQIAVRVGAIHAERRALDARLFTGHLIQQFHFVAMRLRPADVGALEHLHPVLGVG